MLHLPVLAVVLSPHSFSPFQLAAAARGLCRLAFVANPHDPLLAGTLPMLKRFGAVVAAKPGVDGTVVDELRQLDAQGVAAYTDASLPDAAALAESLGLHHHSREVAARLTDKHLQRQLLREAGVPVPDFALVPAGTPPEVAIAGAPALPVVVKPRRGSSSRDARRANTADELLAALAATNEEDVLVEHFIEDTVPPEEQVVADFVSVETVVDAGVSRVIEVTGRFPLAPPFRETGSFMPSDLDDDRRAMVTGIAAEAATALGVEHGCLHTEIKLTPTAAEVIEVNGRVGGGVPQMLDEIGGPEILRWSMAQALGLPAPVHAQPSRGVGFFLWLQPPQTASRIRSVSGVDKLRELDGVHSVRLNLQPGDPVDWRVGGLGHVVAVEGAVEDHAALHALRRDVLRCLDVTYDEDPGGPRPVR